MLPLPARRPGPRPSVPKVSPSDLFLLQRLRRLRVLTSFQAHWLVEPLHTVNPETGRPLTERNTRSRLQRLVEEGFLKAALSQPEKGGYSGLYYRLGGKGLRVLGPSADKNLLVRPALPVLRYLLLRNDVYAHGRQAGWEVVSPILFEEEQHPALLAQVRRWFEGRIEEHAARGDREARARLEQGRVEAPERLAFECLLRSEPGTAHPSALVLVVVDDVRRAIVPVKRRAPAGHGQERDGSPPPPAQAEDLPPLLPGAGLLLRDSQSCWNTTTRSLEPASPRLQQWRRVLSKKYGQELLDTDTLFPELWSWRTRSTGSGDSQTPVPDGEGEG